MILYPFCVVFRVLIPKQKLRGHRHHRRHGHHGHVRGLTFDPNSSIYLLIVELNSGHKDIYGRNPMPKKGSQRYAAITSPVHAKHPPETMVQGMKSRGLGPKNRCLMTGWDDKFQWVGLRETAYLFIYN